MFSKKVINHIAIATGFIQRIRQCVEGFVRSALFRAVGQRLQHRFAVPRQRGERGHGVR